MGRQSAAWQLTQKPQKRTVAAAVCAEIPTRSHQKATRGYDAVPTCRAFQHDVLDSTHRLPPALRKAKGASGAVKQSVFSNSRKHDKHEGSCPISWKTPQMSANLAQARFFVICPICWESQDIGHLSIPDYVSISAIVACASQDASRPSIQAPCGAEVPNGRQSFRQNLAAVPLAEIET